MTEKPTSSGLLSTLEFGPLHLRTNLFLSPLAGYTTLPFRLAVRAIGGLDLCTTDLVNAKSLLMRNPKALQLVATCVEDSPLAVQLFGADPGEMREAAQMLEEMGVASVDVNMGCPVRKVVRTGSGSLLMTAPENAAKLIEAMVSGVKIPVTAKMRLGWDSTQLTAPDLARALEGAGVAAVFVHGRTRAQGFSGRVDLAGIRAVAAAVDRVPVVGNGDVTTPAAARRMFMETGCSGVSIGRGAFYNPWIFRQTAELLESGEVITESGFEERLKFIVTHLDRMIEFHGPEKGCVLFRKIAPWYARQLGPAAFFRRRVSRIQSRDELLETLAGYREWRLQFLDESGELQPRYRPAAAAVDFADSDAGDAPAISVPSGPNAVW